MNISTVRPGTDELFNVSDKRLLSAIVGCIASDLNQRRRVVVSGTVTALSALKGELSKNPAVKIAGPQYKHIKGVGGVGTSRIRDVLEEAHDPGTQVLLVPNTSSFMEGYAIFGYDTYYPVSCCLTSGDNMQLQGRFLRISLVHKTQPFCTRIVHDESEVSMTETAVWLKHFLTQTNDRVSLVPLQARAELTELTPVPVP